jgi:hypothetical protein
LNLLRPEALAVPWARSGGPFFVNLHSEDHQPSVKWSLFAIE